MRCDPRLGVAALIMLAGALTGCGSVEEPVLAPAWTAADAARPLTHADCVRLACDAAPTAAAWEARRRGAAAALSGAGLPPNPGFNATWEDFALAPGVLTPVQRTFSLTYAIAKLATLGREKSQAQAEYAADEATIRSEQQRLAVAVIRAYDDVLAARARAALSDEAVAQADDILGITTRLAAAGQVPRIDERRAAAALADARADRAATAATARATSLALVFALGFDRPVELQLADGLTGGLPADIPAAFDDRLHIAAEHHPDIAAARARYTAALEHAQLTAETPWFMPVVGFGSRTQDGERRGVASIEFELPIFNAGRPARDAAEAALLGAAATLRATGHTVAAAVAQAADALAAAESVLGEYAVPIAIERASLLQSTLRLRRAGEVTFEEQFLAARDATTARRAVVDAEIAAAHARVDLLAALGVVDG